MSFKPTLKIGEPYFDYREVADWLEERYPELNMRKVWNYLVNWQCLCNGSYFWIDTEDKTGDEYFDQFLVKLEAEFYGRSFRFRASW